MGRHQQVRGTRVAPSTRPRYPRISAAITALLVTLVSILGGIGLLPGTSGDVPAADAKPAAAAPRHDDGGTGEAELAAAPTEAPTGRSAETDERTPRATVPANSGDGRRIVFAMGSQRVWLVGARHGHDVVRRTYLVSGSVTDNLSAGTYEVYSKSEHAIGVDDSGTMRYMVRFAHGPHAAIGFHDIPVLNGHRVQTRTDLGTPRSHGCIRQWRPDAKALWRFAPVGTKVVVVA